jgi:hypothetical protein
MNADQMLDYALDQFDDPARCEVERSMAVDPATADRVERLTRAVRLLLDDGDDDAYAPPPDLARRTIARVAETRERRRRRTILDFVPASRSFRWGDVAVAASIFFAALLTLIPPASRARERMAQAGCTYNLQQLGRALWLYGNKHHHYPTAPDQVPDVESGSHLAMLNEDGLLPDDLAILDCPSSGHRGKHAPVPGFQELIELRAANRGQYNAALHTDYAYNISLKHCAAGVDEIQARHGIVPLMSDQPDHDGALTIRPGNSPNHSGRGQNVLYSDLHVGFHPTRRLGPDDPDMFLNRAGQLSPGDDETDAVLTPSLVPFRGQARVIPVSR